MHINVQQNPASDDLVCQMCGRAAFLKLWYTYHWWYYCNCQVVQLKAGRKLNFFTSQGKKVKRLTKEEEFRNSTFTR